MSAEVRQNDLLAYERLTRASRPAMTWSMHAIGFLEFGNFEKAEELFRRSYQTYIRPPFNVCPLSLFILLSNRLNCIFVAVLFGYGGIRLKLNHLEVMPRGHLPNQATKLIFHGLKYLRATLDLAIDGNMYHLTVQEFNGSYSLVYEHGKDQGSLKLNDSLSCPIDTRLIIHPSTPICR
ncbi:unnamed protein product [Rotaria sp. Silwood2]|nr:unnamed protein product [Rotaria sp. Silwood2]CAF3049339.1 unnamed protein product [Rotaria sp. Silwood2]CAF3436757.1 unnamed protein product [Rotaria sp. Silwood2]CAF4219586.1 unnamed protein product [Rotaria sp. Silwood2]CAF4258102.1 unnamed protein product [Rotaria sp. Silwood2]